jgi:hypothetical protein
LLTPLTPAEKPPGEVEEIVPVIALALGSVLALVPVIAPSVPVVAELVMPINWLAGKLNVLIKGNNICGLGYVPVKSPPAGPTGAAAAAYNE